MSAVNRTSDVLSRALPLIVLGAVLVAGYVWVIQPRVTEYLRNRTELEGLEGRVRTLQDSINRGRTAPTADEMAMLKLFEERVSPDDRVSDVVELVARLASDSGPKGKVQGLQIATGPSATWSPGQATSASSSRSADIQNESPDPRFGLFPVALTFTPVTVTFDGSFEAIERFVWQLRDLPTVIEIRSMELTRGLPLMRASLRLFVYQRGAAVDAQAGQPAPAASPSSPLAPRVARLSVGEEL